MTNYPTNVSDSQWQVIKEYLNSTTRVNSLFAAIPLLANVLEKNKIGNLKKDYLLSSQVGMPSCSSNQITLDIISIIKLQKD